MDTLDRNSFIIGFIKGYIESSLERFNKHDGRELLKRVRIVDYQKIQKLAEINAIHCLLYDREMNGDNFTLGEILTALNKTDAEAQEIMKNLEKLPSWKRH